MPAQRLAMRQVHEVLRLKWEQGLRGYPETFFVLLQRDHAASLR